MQSTVTRTTIRFSLVIERVKERTPSSPFPAARKVIDTTGVEVRDSELPPSYPGLRVVTVAPFATRRAG